MSSHSLLLLLLVLACLQSFTKTNKARGPDKCCFSYQTHRIPVRLITEYKDIDRQCTKPGVIFTLKNGRLVCADPDVEWVQNNMKKIDQRLYFTNALFI
ncbi:C-C motif chemokine 3-like [Pangasianodon hypophthalmus]|uniref:C-C motif chemokine 3-like n=1 Tax=Pangasianodon hypophthalmus TaxID=310915 RepID=UPI002306E603|nr:C-C motif chemokine 3-like [Pangasianodon hypophthalmus]